MEAICLYSSGKKNNITNIETIEEEVPNLSDHLVVIMEFSEAEMKTMAETLKTDK